MELIKIEDMIAHHLMKLAMLRKTTNYLDLAREFELPEEWPVMGTVLSPVLYNILNWCQQRRLPPLTVLVVRRSGEDQGIPGRGFWVGIGQPELTRAERRAVTSYLTEEVFNFFTIASTHLCGDPIPGVTGNEPGKEGGLTVDNHLSEGGMAKTFRDMCLKDMPELKR